MAFQFRIDDEDDGAGDALPHTSGTTKDELRDTETRPVEEHTLDDLVSVTPNHANSYVRAV